MFAVIFAYLVGVLSFVNATAVPYQALQVVNTLTGVWFVIVASIAGWQHFNRD